MMESNETDREYHEVGTRRRKALVKDINDGLVEVVAIVCHEANRGYCESQGDTSQTGWNDAPDWQRESARSGVRGILDGSITNPSESHISWRKQKLADGWKYGEVKNPETKEHPCMVDYADLPPEQQMKDFIFHGIVHAMARGAES